MRLIKSLFLTLPLLAGLASCTADLDEHSSWDHVDVPNFSASLLDNGKIVKAQGTWADNAQFGIFASKRGQSVDQACHANVPYAMGADGTLNPVGKKITYTYGEKVDFTAYSPYAAGKGTLIPVDVADQANPSAIDLVVSNNARNKTFGDQQVELNFQHQLSRIILNIENNTGLSSEDLGLSLSGLKTKANFDLPTLSLIPDEASTADINMLIDAEKKKASAIVLPAAKVENAYINATIGGKTASVALNATAFETNVSTLQTLTLSTDANGNLTATLGTSQKGSWASTNGSDISVEEEGGDDGGDEPVVSGVQFKKATEITSGKKYLIAAKVDGVSKVAQAIAANRTYGYIYADDANAQSDVITMDDESHAYTISASGSGYTLKDANGRYLYMTGTYNNFNLTEDASQEGAIWTITKNADGTFKLLNQTMGKYIQWSTQYTSYGSYPDENGIMPELYEQVGGQGDGGGGGNTSSAKSLPYTEEFTSGQGDFTIEDGTLPDGLNFVWKFDSRYGMKATAFVSSNRFEAESWTISPLISLAGASNATLSFQHAGRYFDGNMKDFCTVWAREEGGSWKQITIAAYPDETNWDFIDASASLAEFANKTIQIGFKYTSTTETAGTWEFKNFKVQ